MTRLIVDGIDCSYMAKGKGEALLFIHGLGSSARDWAPQFEAFANDYRLIAPDLFGHGETRGLPSQLSIARMAAQVAATLHAEGLHRVHVVGLSLGGAVALQLALDQPQLVASLVIVNSRPDFTTQSWADRLMVIQRLLLIRLLGMRRMGRFLGRKLFPQDQRLQEQFSAHYARNNKSAYLKSLHALLVWTVADRLAEIGCPSLIVASENDYYPIDAVKAYAKQMPNARVVEIPRAHHAVTMEYPERFNTVLRDFLAEAYDV